MAFRHIPGNSQYQYDQSPPDPGVGHPLRALWQKSENGIRTEHGQSTYVRCHRVGSTEADPNDPHVHGEISKSYWDLRSSVSSYGVLALEPKLILDFKESVFDTNGTASTFDASITHSASTNATMTDGYGPEVVTNGKFGTDTAGWVSGSSAATSAAVSGEMQVTNVSSNGRVITAIPTVVGRQYEVSGVGRVISGTAGKAASLYLTNNFGTTIQSGTINYTTTDAPLGLFFTATATTSYISAITFGSVGNVSAFDNVSVRRSPALKWRPHNMLRYSEDMSKWVYNKWDSRGDVSQTYTQITDSTNPLGASSVTKISPNFLTDPQAASRTVRIYQNAGYTSGGEIITLSVFVKPVTTTSTYPSDTARDLFLFMTSDNASQSMWVNLNTQAVSNSNVTYTSVGDGWYKATSRIIRNATNDSSTNCFIYLANRTNLQSFDPYPQADLDVRITGFHVYKSSLGGMMNNPDASTGLGSYVPTTTTPVYAPRRGHHIYNGDAWVNEGILHESEARTNLFEYSNDFTASSWQTGVTLTPNDAVSPDGTSNASLFPFSSSGYFQAPLSRTIGQTYTVSAWVKSYDGTDEAFQLYAQNGTFNQDFIATSEWQRFSFTYTATSSVGSLGDGIARPTANVPANLYVYGMQLEAGTTASSYIPTSGSAVTRAAETLTVPTANLPWPTYVDTTGTEMVTNGSFDTDLSGWNAESHWTYSNGKAALLANSQSNQSLVSPTAYVEAGKIYRVRFDASSSTGSGNTYLKLRIWGNDNGTGTFIYNGFYINVGSHERFIFPTANGYVSFDNVISSNFDKFIDNVSIKEVNPLALSIQMDGKMTYADTNTDNGKLFSWHLGNADTIYPMLSTYQARTGQIYWVQESGDVLDFVSGPDTSYSPGTNVPFNIASRHGSTFINGAIGGTALTANTTPTILPDLSATDLLLGNVFMGTIGQFRMWSDDLGDAGIVTASSPSTEPSLSLTFDGSETSFTVLDWSE